MRKAKIRLDRFLGITSVDGSIIPSMDFSQLKITELGRLGLIQIPNDFLRWSLANSEETYQGTWLNQLPGLGPRITVDARRVADGIEINLDGSEAEILPTQNDLEKAAYWNSLLKNFSQGILILDSNGRIIEISSSTPALLYLTNEHAVLLTRDSLLGRSFGKHCEPTVLETLTEYQRNVTKHPSFVPSLQLEIRGKILELSAFPILRNQRSTAVCFLILDITQKVRAEQQLRLAEQERAHQSNLVSLGKMAGGIAHEINTPLAIVVLMAEQLMDILNEGPANPAEIVQRLEKIISTSHRIAQIIRGLRLFSRDSSSDPFQKVSVKEMIAETLDFFQERLRCSGVELKISEVPSELAFYGRGVQISQVLLNLLMNAADAIESLSVKWINVSAKGNKDQLEIRVTDSGPGIPEAVREKLFQPFFTTKEIGKGTGLGLSISHGIVRHHGGELMIDTASKNTSFVILIPLYKNGDHQPA